MNLLLYFAMNVLFWSVVFFCVAFFLHILIWKLHLPRRQTRTLLQIFFGTLLIGLFTLWSAKYVSQFDASIPRNFSEYLHIALFVTSLTLAYMITYSALEADSPSLVIVMNIANAGLDGLKTTEFEQLMTNDILIIPRIQDLLRDKMVYMEGEKYKLTAKGMLFARIFIIYRQLLNVSQKGG